MPKDKIPQILTPKGAAITNDDTNIGVHLLKKMGWTQDTGLGKDGKGIVEPIRASSNFGRKGLGKGPMQSAVNMVQQAHFDTILQSLNQNSKIDDSDEDIEQGKNSNLCKTQLRYGKFTRAKDVSNYDQQRLKVILGKAVVESKESSPFENSGTSSGENETENKNDFGVKTYPSSSDLKTYFASKMKKAKSLPPVISHSRKRKCNNNLNSRASKFSAATRSEFYSKDPSDPMLSNKPVSETTKDGSNKLRPSNESSAEAMDVSESKELPSPEAGKSGASDGSTSDSSTSTEYIPGEAFKNACSPEDAQDCFPNSNIFSIKGYPYY
ncbi:hypothetical protein Aperf_G00000069617 [Anoplocephala perfoliata]